MLHRTRRQARAFTLVELLVVIGIIAVLIGVLLPVLSGVQARGRDLKCQANVRSIMQTLYAYCAEHKGAYPYGLVYMRSRDKVHPDPYHPSNDWEAASDNPDGSYICWAGMVGRYTNKGEDGVDENGTVGAELRRTFPPVLLCPEAANVRNHYNSYAMNFIVGVSPVYERRIGGVAPQAQLAPPKQNQLLKDTAVIWDTGVQPDFEEWAGFLVGADIDDERFWRGAHTPQFRYYTQRDVFGRIPPGLFGQNRPVLLSVGSYVFFNREPGPIATDRWPYQGQLRFRHNKGTTCNVGMADGSVRQFTAKLEPGGLKVKSHDALRRYFMIKWPPGVPPNPSTPS